MKILFVFEYYHPHIGGVETLFQNLVTCLVKEGHECVILTQRHNKKLPKYEKSEGVVIHRIRTGGRLGFALFGCFKAFHLAKDCDLVHTTSYAAAFPAWMSAKIRRKKVIITFHEVWGKLWFRLPFQYWLEKFSHYWFERFILGLSFDRFVAPSDATALNLEHSKIPKERILRIYPGIDYSRFKPENVPRPESFTFTYFGRLGISKGLDLLLPSFASLPTETQLKLIIPQEPKRIRKWIDRYIKKHDLSSRVSIRHSLSDEDLKRAIASSNCVVIPSYSEGFCYAAVETVALGTPVISSHQGSLPEVVSGKFVVMENQSEADLKLALEQALRREWEEKPVRQFQLNDSVNEYLKLYQELK